MVLGRRRIGLAVTVVGCFLCLHPIVVFADELKDCWRNDDLDRSIAACSRIIAAGTAGREALARARYNRGNAHDEKGDYAVAVVDLTEAIRLMPGYALAYSSRGLARLHLGDSASAVADYDEAIRLDPSYTAAYTGRGMAHERRGDRDNARKDYARALAIPQKYGSGRWAQDAAKDGLARLEKGDDGLRDAQDAVAALPRPDAAPSASTTAPGRRVALVIGNSAYQHVAPLLNPERDAHAVAEAFRRLGFTVVIERGNLGLTELVAALRGFSDQAAGADWAVIFYAGHGVEVDHVTYVVPVDARLAHADHVEDEALPLSRLLSKAEAARKLRLVILDACRSNPFHMAAAPGGTRAIGRGLGRVEPEGGVLVAYAARDGTTADDGLGGHSPYTEALLGQIEQPGLEINLMFRKVRDSVLMATGNRQEPFTYGSLPGEGLYFREATRR